MKKVKNFFDKFSFLDEIYDMLINFGIKKISLMISCDGSVDKIDDFEIQNKNGRAIVEILYECIMNTKEKYAYDFPNVIITSI